MEVLRGPNVDKFLRRKEDEKQSNEITSLASAKEKLKVMAKERGQ